jgi:aerobic-type carbon monoxide dehydrogenase small subunit (CoxS/CutS family)
MEIRTHRNGNKYTFDVSGDTPLLWILRDNLGLTGTKFGRGIGACGTWDRRLRGMHGPRGWL